MKSMNTETKQLRRMSNRPSTEVKDFCFSWSASVQRTRVLTWPNKLSSCCFNQIGTSVHDRWLDGHYSYNWIPQPQPPTRMHSHNRFSLLQLFKELDKGRDEGERGGGARPRAIPGRPVTSVCVCANQSFQFRFQMKIKHTLQHTLTHTHTDACMSCWNRQRALHMLVH